MTRFLFRGAVSSRASRMEPRSRTETRSRRSCSRTRPTSPRVSNLGTSSSRSLGWLSLSESIRRLVSARPEQFPGVLADQFAEMCGDDRDRVDDGVAGGDGLIFESRRNPDGGHAEGRLPGLLARQRTAVRIAGNGQQVRALRLPAANLHAAQREQILARLEAQIVRDVHGRHKEAHLRGEMAPQRADPAQQLPALLLINQRNQLKPNFERQVFEAQQRGKVGGLRRLPASSSRRAPARAQALPEDSPKAAGRPRRALPRR